MEGQTDVVDRSGIDAGDRELGLDATLSAPVLRQWVGLMELALGAAGVCVYAGRVCIFPDLLFSFSS